MRNKPLIRLAVCLTGMTALVLQSCTGGGTDRDKLYRPWADMDDRSDVLTCKEGETYKVTTFARNDRIHRLRPQTYLLVEEDGNLFIDTGYRIDVSYNKETNVLTLSPSGDYVWKEEHP